MTSSPEKTVLILIPAYNAARHLSNLISRLCAFMPAEDILIVDDGSTDDTPEVLKRTGCRFMRLPHNRGKGAALRAGFEQAIQDGYRSVVTLDADLQHVPEELTRLLDADDGRQIIIGTRQINWSRMPWPRWLSNSLTSLIISVFSGQRVRDSQSGFRLLPVHLLQSIRLQSDGYDLESELLFKAGALGCRIGEVPVSTVYAGSHSHISPVRDTLRFVRQMWNRLWF